MKKIIRFFEIDINYLKVKGPFLLKCENILITNFSIVLNIVLKIIFDKKNNFFPVPFNAVKVYYDTLFSTKTFLSATYDFYTETCSLQIFSKSPVVVDVGANIGQFLFAVKFFLPSAEVYAFEPDKNVFKILEKNTNKMKKVHTYNLALGEYRGKSEFYVNNEFSEWSTLILHPSYRYKKTEVDINKGDSLLKELNVIDLLKIDVEGAEMQVIKGMEKTLKKVKYLLIEISIARNIEDPGSSNLIRHLFSMGFHIHTIGRIFSEGKGKNQQAVDVLFKNTYINLSKKYA